MQLILSYEFLEDKFAFLDELRESGSINMFGAATTLVARYRIGKVTAHKVLTLWMKTFDEDVDIEDRVTQAMEMNEDD